MTDTIYIYRQRESFLIDFLGERCLPFESSWKRWASSQDMNILYVILGRKLETMTQWHPCIFTIQEGQVDKEREQHEENLKTLCCL